MNGPCLDEDMCELNCMPEAVCVIYRLRRVCMCMSRYCMSVMLLGSVAARI